MNFKIMRDCKNVLIDIIRYYFLCVSTEVLHFTLKKKGGNTCNFVNLNIDGDSKRIWNFKDLRPQVLFSIKYFLFFF